MSCKYLVSTSLTSLINTLLIYFQTEAYNQDISSDVESETVNTPPPSPSQVMHPDFNKIIFWGLHYGCFYLKVIQMTSNTISFSLLGNNSWIYWLRRRRRRKWNHSSSSYGKERDISLILLLRCNNYNCFTKLLWFHL